MDLPSSNLICSKVNCIPIDPAHSLVICLLSFFFFFAMWFAES